MEKRSIFLILLVLIMAGVLVAGCATQNPATVTPTPVPPVTTEMTAAPMSTQTTAVPTTTQTTAAPITTQTTAVPKTTQTTAAPMTNQTTVASTTQAATMNIVETLAADGRFTTLVTTLKAAQLDGNLSGPGPFTVFAPTDTAFKKLPAGTIDSLLKDPQKYYLKKMLLYHVVNKELMAADVMRLGSINTIQGQSLLIDVSNGIIFVNGNAKVITPDIVCSNGVIHVIDTVLTPP
jgi:uncharacterized surface protein with fasciclin (FAS1) repeats